MNVKKKEREREGMKSVLENNKKEKMKICTIKGMSCDFTIHTFIINMLFPIPHNLSLFMIYSRYIQDIYFKIHFNITECLLP